MDSKTGGRGRGRTVGSKNMATLEKEASREAFRVQVLRKMGPMIEAQITKALGLKFLMVRDAAGKFLRVGKGKAEKLNPAEEIIEVWEEDPSTQAFTDLMNRALGLPEKPPEQMRHSGAIELHWKDTA